MGTFFAFDFNMDEIERTDALTSSPIRSKLGKIQKDEPKSKETISNDNIYEMHERQLLATTTLSFVSISDYYADSYNQDEASKVFPFDILSIGGLGDGQTKEETISPCLPMNLKRVRFLKCNNTRQHHPCANTNNSGQQHNNDSDLIPGIYEGGLKTWECSIDLCRYIYELYSIRSNDLSFALNGKTLELGCGHGLPGILVSLLGQDANNKVLFSDYNEYVLKDCTLINLFLNTPEYYHSSLQSRMSLVSGDWMQLSERMMRNNSCDKKDCSKQFAQIFSSSSSEMDGRFDLILAAETTYTETSAKDTATLISRHLQFESGVGLVATKRYYFGVGGGSSCFRSFAETIRVERSTENNQQHQPTLIIYSLKIDTVKVFDDGVGNIREIFRVKLHKLL